jgi:hypothetical protein
MKAQAVPRTAEVLRAATRKASWTRQKMSRLSGFSRGFRLLALVAMATIASLEQCGLRVFLRDYSRKQMKLRGSMTIFTYDRAYNTVPISKFALSSGVKSQFCAGNSHEAIDLKKTRLRSTSSLLRLASREGEPSSELKALP